MENQLIVLVKGEQKKVDLPAFGEVKITVVAGEVKFIETTTKEKIDQ